MTAGFSAPCSGTPLVSSFARPTADHRAGNRSSPLAKPTIKEILNGNSGQLLVRVTPVRNSRMYRVRIALLGPDGQPGRSAPAATAQAAVHGPAGHASQAKLAA